MLCIKGIYSKYYLHTYIHIVYTTSDMIAILKRCTSLNIGISEIKIINNT